MLLSIKRDCYRTISAWTKDLGVSGLIQGFLVARLNGKKITRSPKRHRAQLEDGTVSCVEFEDENELK